MDFKKTHECDPDEFITSINAEDYDTMLEKVMDLVVQGLKATMIDDQRDQEAVILVDSGMKVNELMKKLRRRR